MKHQTIILLSATLLVGCSDSSNPRTPPSVSTEQQRSASQSMGLSFPAETRFLFYHRANEEGSRLPGPDDSVQLKIELPASALAKFLSQPPLDSATWTASRPTISDNPKWPEWQPSTIKTFRSEQFQLPHGQVLNVLIDEDQAKTKVVYLYWFET